MNRYGIIHRKFSREIVLLKASPCRWGKCRFCDYILDNSTDVPRMIATNRQVLRQVVLEVGIEELVFEAHWMYRHRLQGLRDFFKGISLFFKTGIETFHEGFRNGMLNKGISYDRIEEVAAYFDAPCLLIGVQGQDRHMIQTDIDLVLRHFKRATLNLYHNNQTPIGRDPHLIEWFMKELYPDLEKNPRLDILLEISDFGVG